MQYIPELYGMHKEDCTIESFGSGLINNTWLVNCREEKYILQKINKEVFPNPELIDDNIQVLNDYLLERRAGYRFITPLPTLLGKTMIYYKDEYYRLFKFISSVTYSVADDAQVAFEGAKQFGTFTKVLSGFNADELYETIPHFHDLHLRYTQFEQALVAGNHERIQQSQSIIESLQQHKNIVDVYDVILKNPSFKKRVTHHDTKINNVLFDENKKGIAVIDLDTVMPGYFISDVGDMMRTYLPPVSEEETNFDLVEVRDEYFKAIAQGYLGVMKDELFPEEINAFVYSGKFMIYMQALRFITDYLNNDVYYGAKYELHNYNRAQNQLRLLECLMAKEKEYNLIVQQLVSN